MRSSSRTYSYRGGRVRLGHWYVRSTTHAGVAVRGTQWLFPDRFRREDLGRVSIHELYRRGPRRRVLVDGWAVYVSSAKNAHSREYIASVLASGGGFAHGIKVERMRGLTLFAGGELRRDYVERRPPAAVIEALEEKLRSCVRHADCLAHHDLGASCWRERNRHRLVPPFARERDRCSRTRRSRA